RAATLLAAAGHPASEATLRRVIMNLSAVAAAGSFDPDPAGALTGDRDPPGFDLAGLTVPDAPPERAGSAPTGGEKPPDAAEERRRVEEQRQRALDEKRRADEERERLIEQRRRSEEERRRIEAARAQQRAERH